MSEKYYFFSLIKDKVIKININPDKLISLFYSNKIRIPFENEINNKKIIDYDSYINNIKSKTSILKTLIPLYDIYSSNIYLIKHDNVHIRVYKDHYRFISNNELDTMKKEYDIINNLMNLTEIQKSYKKKLKNNIDFLINFNLDIMFESYIKSVYFGSNEVGKNITYCKKPTFIPYINTSTPYYTRSELINLALNLKIIKEDTTYYNNKKLNKLCKKVSKNDLTSDIIINHQNYIKNNNSKHIVQFYSFLGYYFINNYLRNKTSFKDVFLEKLIIKMWSLILKAPKLNYSKKKKYVLYRFVDSIEYLSHLKVGDEYIDNSFISTTRNPFYKKNDTFGYNLIKIIIKNDSKILCMETYSHFKNEQEVLFPPGSKFKLLSIDNNYTYYHTNTNLQNLIEKKYEFEYIGNEKPYIKSSTHLNPDPIPNVDFKEIYINGETIDDKIIYFIKKYTNKNKQFYIKINNKKYYFYCDFYDSSELYKKFFFIKNQTDGFYIYSFNDNGQYNFFIEIGDYISVNYLNKYTDFNYIDNDIFLLFISYIANSFKISKIIIHPKYFSNITFFKNKLNNHESIDQNSADLYYYNFDFYQYIKYNKKQLNDNNIIPDFSYKNLDIFDETLAIDILNKNDHDPIHSLYLSINNNNLLLSKFYIYISENYFYYLNFLIKKINRFFKKKSPFYKTYYTFYPLKFLFNKKLIPSIPINLSIKSKSKLISNFLEDFSDIKTRDIMRR
jgi:hypothetical protein